MRAQFDNAISNRFYWNLIQIKIEMKGKLAMAATTTSAAVAPQTQQQNRF